MTMRMHALKIGLLGTLAGPPLFLLLAACFYALWIGLAVLCVVLFPVMAIFFPERLIEFTRPTDEDRAIAARIDRRLGRVS